VAKREASGAIGLRAHAGWAAAVCLAGEAEKPVVIGRERLLLTNAPLPWEPYHAAGHLDLERGESLVSRAAVDAEAASASAIGAIAESLAAGGYRLKAAGVLLGKGRPDFTFKQAISNHAAMHNAEGWLFRGALKQASEQRGLAVLGVLEDGVYEQAASALGISPAALEAQVQVLGRELGPPWGRDQKLAAAAAWLALIRDMD
jgi:hypothetical protein